MKIMRTTIRVVRNAGFLVSLTISIAVNAAPDLAAGRISDVVNTKHNFSAQYEPDLPAGDVRTVKAATENQVCVFCHTPHGKPNLFTPFLWNRNFPATTYTLYSSSSMNSPTGEPGTGSKMCLSCHDGAVALGNVNVFTDTSSIPSKTSMDATIAMIGAAGDGTMPAGLGADTGYTRDLGTDLSNDHPIGMMYSSAFAGADGELRDPMTTPEIGVRVGSGVVAHNLSQVGTRPADAPITPLTRVAVPLEGVLAFPSNSFATVSPSGTVECTTCHDPHIRSTDNSINIKFLRLNRLQKTDPGVGNSFSKDNDINCIACHEKAGWGASAHANPIVADEVYDPAAAALREFPANTQVWEASCVSCHDPHTVKGARWLLREGASGSSSAGIMDRYKLGNGGSATEETCYQCHSSNGVLLNLTNVADIEFEALKGGHQMNLASETHDILGPDFTEDQTNLQNNRHVECSDCHNPHRMTKNQVITADPTTPDASGIHIHAAGTMHTNVISGALRGTWGVEPTYSSVVEFNPTNVPTYNSVAPDPLSIKQGDPGIAATDAVSNDYVTREYQVCLKCHSNYANNPAPGATYQDMEFQAPSAHKGDISIAGLTGFGPDAAYEANNHRSWHPVIDSTGRTTTEQMANPNNWVAPFDTAGALGNQTMYCSDCHGNDNALGAKGPHGSNILKLLTASYNNLTGSNTPNDLCFQCHDYSQYADPAANAATANNSGFSCINLPLGDCGGLGGSLLGGSKNLHIYHANQVGGIQCTACHVAQPHGWKNKALLVNLNDVGAEFGAASAPVGSGPYTLAPYYDQARLQVSTFAKSGEWSYGSCGASSGCHLP